MLFNTFAFFIFFIIVYTVYLRLSHKWQNRMLLAASYIFYGWWDWRFLFLIIASSVVGYYTGLMIGISSEIRKKRYFLSLSIIYHIIILGFFKYYNFFINNLESLLGSIGVTNVASLHLSIILPVGLSFYTFQTMSYSLDIYFESMKPTRKFLDFALFVAFFPQLVAGPIERASRLLPQIQSPRRLSLEKFYGGCWLIFWGLFMKVCIADNLSKLVDPVYGQASFENGAVVVMATYAFTFQIFCDFAGYSSIARGLGKCMGFDIMMNFRTPFFSTTPQEYWQRWHISLTSWFRDYLFIPLCTILKGNRYLKIYIGILITTTLSGLWHGAAWHFVLWGTYWGVLIVLHHAFRSNKFISTFNLSRYTQHSGLRILIKAIGIILFFQFIAISMLLFRAPSMHHVFDMLVAAFTKFKFTAAAQQIGMQTLLYALPILFITFFEYKSDDKCFILKWHPVIKGVIYCILFWLLLIYGTESTRQFIYFQF